MSKKLAIIEKNVLFYRSLPSEYHPLHHTTQILFSLGVIRRPEAGLRIWRNLHDSVSYLKTSPLFFLCESFAGLFLRGAFSFLLQYHLFAEGR